MKLSTKQNKQSALWSLAIISLSFFLGNCKVSLDIAQQNFDKGYYGQAAQQAELVTRKGKEKAEKQKAYLLAAEAHRMNNNYKDAIKYYDRFLKKDPKNTVALYNRANCLKSMEKNEEAIDAYTAYLQEVPGDSVAIRKREGLEMKLIWNPDSSRYKVENFKEANVKGVDDWAPMVADKRDKLLYFVSDREGGIVKKTDPISMEGYADIWYMEKAVKRGKESWTKPMVLKEASTKWNDGAVGFDTRYSTMYMTQCNGIDGKGKNCMIYSMKKVGKDWLIQEPVDFCTADTAHFYGHPVLSPDGSQMYFSSNRDGGYGGFDIWVSNFSKRGKTWGEPINLGPQINTEGNEYYPYFNQHDGKLYFSSDGWPGAGGLDIFKIKPTEDITIWQKRENLKLPMNSGGDDLGITFTETDPNAGFFSSNRNEKSGRFDIYRFYIEPCSIVLHGTITDCKSTETLKGATIEISNNSDTAIIRLKADETGSYTTLLESDKIYEVKVTYPELYYFAAEPIKISTIEQECGDYLRDFCLKSPFDELLTLPIFYDLDKYNIRPDAEKVLDDFARTVLIKYPKLKAELGSHTDCRSSEDYNQELATNRAKAAVAYLRDKWKIDSARIQWKGYGEKELVNKCACEGTEVSGLTPYIMDNGKPTQKLVVTKDGSGNVVSSKYIPYSPSEIKTVDGKQYVACDEYQHQQNRRTTVRFNTDDITSRVKVNMNIDGNNAAIVDSSKAGTGIAAKPEIDISYATRARVFEEGGKKFISAMVNGKDAQKFQFEYDGRYTAITPELAAEWMQKGMINKGDFTSGETMKVGKVKLYGNAFTVNELEINGYKLTRVAFKIIPADKMDGQDAILGRNVFRNFLPTSYVEGNEYILIPKRKPRGK